MILVIKKLYLIYLHENLGVYAVVYSKVSTNTEVILLTSIFLSFSSLIIEMIDDNIVKMKDIFYLRKFTKLDSNLKQSLNQVCVLQIIIMVSGIMIFPLKLHRNNAFLITFGVLLFLNLLIIFIFYVLLKDKKSFIKISKYLYLEIPIIILTATYAGYMKMLEVNLNSGFFDIVLYIYSLLLLSIPLEHAINDTLKNNEAKKWVNLKVTQA